MTETNESAAPEENKQDPAQQEEGLRAELARVRGRNNTLKIVAGVLLSLFIIIGAVGFLVYRKISAAKANFEDVFRAFPPPTPGYQPENRTLPTAQGVNNSTSMPASSLGLFSGEMPGGGGYMPPGFSPEKSEQIVKAMNKYADRPIVKEFIADLKKDPNMASAFAASKGKDPMAVFASMKNSKGGVDRLMMKYVTRPEFMKLMMEVMGDPEMKPFLQNMPGAIPSGLPQGMGIPQPPDQEPDSSRLSEEEDGGGEITFDPSAISGPAKPASSSSRKARQPVDSDE